ncbi:MAG: SEC-C metal-binding domain-containing protein [Candidatus Neptunochlamydia sp.]|nr:SEC-C metal-binding domain-containing protein [Candidatus Neptunochlamydia sp.]
MKEAGRNDPCPCGSGKKYKKCCAQKSSMERRSFTAIDPSSFQSIMSRITGMVSKTLLDNTPATPAEGLEKKVHQKGSPPKEDKEA